MWTDPHIATAWCWQSQSAILPCLIYGCAAGGKSCVCAVHCILYGYYMHHSLWAHAINTHSFIGSWYGVFKHVVVVLSPRRTLSRPVPCILGDEVISQPSGLGIIDMIHQRPGTMSQLRYRTTSQLTLRGQHSSTLLNQTLHGGLFPSRKSHIKPMTCSLMYWSMMKWPLLLTL